MHVVRGRHDEMVGDGWEGDWCFTRGEVGEMAGEMIQSEPRH